MVTLVVLLQLIIVLTMIFIGARVGGIGMGIYGMVGVFILVFIFGMRPGNIPIDVMLIIAEAWTIWLDWRISSCASILPALPTMVR